MTTEQMNEKLAEIALKAQTLDEQMTNLAETIDAAKALIVLNNPNFQTKIDANRDYKIKRWASRIEKESGIKIDID